jgi:hypothetical protein
MIEYGFKTYGLWNSSWRSEDYKRFHKTDIVEYSRLDSEMLIKIALEELDVPNYDITFENIKNEHKKYNPTISDACVQRILDYYAFRKDLFKRVEEVSKMTSCMHGAKSTMFRFDLPAKFNSFSMNDEDYDSVQIDAWIEVTVKVDEHVDSAEARPKKVFISGPMTGLPKFNYPKFNTIEKKLIDAGVDCVNPVHVCLKYNAEIVQSNPVKFQDMIDEQQKLERECDAIVLLDGWSKSKGVRLELKTALELGMKIYLEEELDNVASCNRV